MKISKFKRFYKKNIKGLKNKSGRNKKGKLLIKSKGGGHKKCYRKIENLKNKYVILSQHYDPYRTSNIMLIKDLKTSNYKYTIAPNKIKPMQIINYNKQSVGSRMKMKNINTGQIIHAIENKPGKKITFVKAGGTFAQILYQTKDNKTKILLPSNKKKLILNNCEASIGKVSVKDTYKPKLKKAGNSRWRNKRPHVRGVAMNPIDHPHGGGEGKTSGGRPSVTPKGWPGKGRPTKKNKIIII